MFDPLVQLKYLYLNNNQLKVIHSESFGNLSNLTEAYFYNNQIDAIDEAFINNTGITRMDVRNNTCANVNILDTTPSRDSMRAALAKCFENWAPGMKLL